jgi:hypothetical protein
VDLSVASFARNSAESVPCQGFSGGCRRASKARIRMIVATTRKVPTTMRKVHLKSFFIAAESMRDDRRAGGRKGRPYGTAEHGS